MLGPCFEFLILDVLYCPAIILLRKRAGCFVSTWCGYPCPVSLPHEATGQSAVCDCEITWSYSFVERRGLLAIQVTSSLYKYMK